MTTLTPSNLTCTGCYPGHHEPWCPMAPRHAVSIPVDGPARPRKTHRLRDALCLIAVAIAGAVALRRCTATAHASTLGDCVKDCGTAQAIVLRRTHTTVEAKVCDEAAVCCRKQCEGKPCKKSSCASVCLASWDKSIDEKTDPVRANNLFYRCEDRCGALAGAEGPGCGKPPQPPCLPPSPKKPAPKPRTIRG